MIRLVLHGARRLRAKAGLAVPCWLVVVLLDHAVGIGWISRLKPAQVAESPALIAATISYSLCRVLPLGVAAIALTAGTFPTMPRIIGVVWAELVLRALPTAAVLAFAGFFTSSTSFGHLDVAALATFWLAGGGLSDFMAMFRPARWGAYAQAVPGLFVLARVAEEQPWAKQPTSAGVILFGLAGSAAVLRLAVACDAIGITAPPLPWWSWWAGLCVAGFLDVLIVGISAEAWDHERKVES